MVYQLGRAQFLSFGRSRQGDKQAKHDQGKESVKVARSVWQGHLASSCITSYIIWSGKLALQATSTFHFSL